MEMTTVKTVAVFMIIFGCFAILYPKIFHPMLLQVFGVGGRDTTTEDLINSRTSPHLKKPGKGIPAGDDIARHMRAGPHPGMRAAAEMKKQAGTQTPGAGKGMMSIVLPMYAIGIVVYLLYTMTKVFGGKQSAEKNDFLSSHFTDVKYDPDSQKFTSTLSNDDGDSEESLSKRFKKGRMDLERLLLKADKNNISTNEMHELKRRLLETESQMTRILSAMETVQKHTEEVVKDAAREAGAGVDGAEAEWIDDEDGENVEEIEAEPRPPKQNPSPQSGRSPNLSPDMDSYEFINRQSQNTSPASSLQRSPSIEELCAQIAAHMEMADDEDAEENCDNEEDYSPDIPENVNDFDYLQSEQAESPEDGEEVMDEMTEEVLMDENTADVLEEKHPDLRKRLPHDFVDDSVPED